MCWLLSRQEDKSCFILQSVCPFNFHLSSYLLWLQYIFTMSFTATIKQDHWELESCSGEECKTYPKIYNTDYCLSREIIECVSVWAERTKPKWFCVWFTLNTALTSVVKLWEETVSNVLHSLAYFQITCFDPQQLKCYAHSVTSFCLSKDSAHMEGSSRCL